MAVLQSSLKIALSTISGLLVFPDNPLIKGKASANSNPVNSIPFSNIKRECAFYLELTQMEWRPPTAQK